MTTSQLHAASLLMLPKQSVALVARQTRFLVTHGILGTSALCSVGMARMDNREASDPSGRVARIPSRKFSLSSLLLALTVLANFINATTAAVLILTTVIGDLVRWRNAVEAEPRRLERGRLISHILSPLLGGSLTLFWLAPMLSEYRYFVTRPYEVETQSLISPGLAVWFAIALIGSVIWVRGDQKRRQVASLQMWPYLGACVILAVAVIFAAIFAPSWFPLQTPRFLATLTFLLTVPVGFALAAAFRWLTKLLGEISSKSPTIQRVASHYSVKQGKNLLIDVSM